MNYNEIISRWYYGQVRWTDGTFVKKLVHQDVNGPESWRWLSCAEFDSDPSAWDSSMWEFIEGEGLWGAFIDHLHGLAYNVASNNCLYSFKRHLWSYIKSTPEQKARALAKAIKEKP